jgi:hypothetical protein
MRAASVGLTPAETAAAEVGADEEEAERSEEEVDEEEVTALRETTGGLCLDL